MLKLLPTLIEEFQQKVTALMEGVPRETKLVDIPNKIMVAIGMRRTGKTYFLLQIIADLLASGITLDRILYINFEDDRLGALTQEKLAQLLDNFYTLYPQNHERLCYLFLDEIQVVEQWHTVVRRYIDSKKVKIYLTGSSAKLLSKEIASSLRGRSIATEIWPFSFTELLQARQISLSTSNAKKNLDLITHWLKTYLQQGGFPETVMLEHNDPRSNNQNQETRRRILQDYVSVVTLRDIIERHRITHIALIKYLIHSLLKNVGSRFSVHKFHKDLRSQGSVVAKNTIHDYLGYIQDAYLAFAVPIYSESLRQTHSNPRKIYAVDTGLINACTFSNSENIGHQFENLIYLDLRRAGHQVYYYLTTTRKEVDFLSQDPLGKWHLFQVCYDMADAQTEQREMAALQEAEQELKKLVANAMCITPDNYFTTFLPNIRLKSPK